MPIVEGIFTCSELDLITKQASDVFGNEIMQAGKQINSATVQQVVANQTARFPELENTDKDLKTKVYWTLDCDTADPVACTNSCDITTGDDLGSECKEYELTSCFEKTWTTKETTYRTNRLDMIDVTSEQLSQKLKVMDEALNQRAIAFLQANAGTNEYLGSYAAAGGCTQIPAADWTPNIMAYMQLVSYYNQFNTNVISTGSDRLWGAMWNATMNNGTQAGGNDLAKLRSIYGNIVHDGLGFVKAGVPNKTYTWNGGSLALVSKNFYSERVQTLTVNGKHTDVYSVASPSIPGVRYDLVHQMTCDNTVTGAIRWVHAWKLFFTGDFLANPLGCTATRTGILCFDCV